jgi:hypothetical protein
MKSSALPASFRKKNEGPHPFPLPRDCVAISKNQRGVMLSEAKHLAFPAYLESRDSSAMPQNDITTQSPKGEGLISSEALVYPRFEFNSQPGNRNSEPHSAAGQRVFDQVINVVEVNFIDAREDFESARRLVLEKDHNRGFNRRTAGLHTRNLFDDDRRVGREA